MFKDVAVLLRYITLVGIKIRIPLLIFSASRLPLALIKSFLLLRIRAEARMRFCLARMSSETQNRPKIASFFTKSFWPNSVPSTILIKDDFFLT